MTPFGAWLRDKIEERLMNVRQFSSFSGIPYQSLHNWLSGANEPEGPNLVRLARALGITKDQIEANLTNGRVAKRAAG